MYRLKERILPFLTLWIVWAAAYAEHAFSTEPSVQPYYVRENEPGPILNCAFSENYRNRDRYEPEWTRVIGGTPKRLARDSTVFLKNDYSLHEDAQTGEYNLQIKIVKFEKDNGQFFCSLLDRESGEQILSTPATVMVVVPPNQPTITVQPSQPVKENEFVTIHCESTGGNPPPKFSWIFNNNSVVPAAWYQDKSESAPRATSISVLQWRVSAHDNGAYLTCQIWNEAMQKDELKTVESNRLNILFAPRVSVGPVSEYNVEEDEPIELTCNAEGNPLPTQFEWLHVATGERMVGKQWKFIANKKMRGDFRCTAVNSIDMGAEKLSMNVFYAPTISVPQVSNPAEGDHLALECEIDANPPPEEVFWTGPNGFNQAGPRLTIDPVHRDHTGNFTCQAENSFTLFSTGETVVRRTGKATTLVDVKRKPGKALITASQPFVNVGEALTLSCITEDLGSPEAKYRWATPSSNGIYSQDPDHNRQSINIPKAELADNGLYRCVAYNSIGQGDEAVMKVTVIEAARISRPLSPNRILTAGDVDASVDCEATGYPQPQIKWFKNGRPITENLNSHWVVKNYPTQTSCNHGDFCPWTVTSSLRFSKTVEWSDKGNYTCVAENGANGPLAQASTVLNVIHDPVVLNERYPTDGLAAADLGETARIICKVSARPEPKFIWTREGLEITDTDERLMIHATKIYNTIDEYESVLEISGVDPSDMGSYVCKAVNGQSSEKTAEIIIQLQPKSKPHIPQSIQLYEALPTSIVVSWRPGFDGGYHQYFELEYRIGSSKPGSPDMSNPTIFVLDDHNATSLAIFENDQSGPRARRSLQAVNFLIHNLTMLNPMTVYWYRIRSRNPIGYSDWSPIASAMTLDVSESIDIQPPTSLVYYEEARKISFEPLRPANDSCLLLYIGGSDGGNNGAPPMWRTLGCFPGDRAIENIEPTEHFKARYCHRNDLSVCSASVEILVATSAMSGMWYRTIIWPLLAVIAIIGLALLLLFLCCKTRVFSKKTEKAKKKFAAVIGDAERAEVSAPMPQIEAKNTPVHGSLTDSGVFTIGSNAASHPANQGSVENGYNNESEECAESWQNTSEEHFNYNNDHYMTDYNGQYGNEIEYPAATSQPPPSGYQPYYDGYMASKADPATTPIQVMSTSDEQTDGSSETPSFQNGSRRVMREIIV